MDNFKTIEFQGRTIDMYSSMRSLEKMAKLEKEREGSLLWPTVILFYSMYENACFKLVKKRELTIEQFEAIVDDMFNCDEGEAIIKDVADWVAGTYAVKSLAKNTEQIEEAKKKLLISTE